MVSSEQEAQQAQTPVILLLIVPMMCMQLVANDPRGGGAQLLTTLPFSSPILMPMRYLLDGASGGQVALSLGILTVATWLVAWLASRIYRVGILLYGKRPSLRELARWIRYS
jgi:ABC-2 type transport system permease protein